jgi:O-antigen/teichoic acid export membrane protein
MAFELGPDGHARLNGLRRAWRRLRGSTFVVNLTSVVAATLASRLIGLVTLGYTARVLGPERYGLVGFGASVAAYAGIVLSPGLMTWGTRAVARDHASAGRTLVIVNATKVALAGLAFTGLAAFATLGIEDPDERMMVLLSGTLLLNTALSADWVFNGLERMKTPSGLGVLATALNSAGLLLFVRSPDHAWRVPVLVTLTGLIVQAIGYATLFRRIGVRPVAPTGPEVRAALVSSLPLGLTVAIVVVLHYANNLIVQAYLGSEALGIFLAAFRLVELATTVPGLLAGVFLPRLSHSFVVAASDAARKAAQFARIHAYAAFLVAPFFLAEAPAIVRILYGERFEGAAVLLRVMSVAVIGNFAISGYTNCLISFGRDRVMLAVVLVSASVAIGGGLSLVPTLGLLGAAVTISAVDLLGWLSSLPAYRATIGSLQASAWARPAAGGAAIVATSFLLQAAGAPVWIRVPAALAAYSPFALREARELLR